MTIDGDTRDRLKITFQDSQNETLSFFLFGPNSAFAKTEKEVKFQRIKAVKRVLEIVNCFYDEPIDIDADSWEEFLRKAVVKWMEGDTSTRLSAVIVYNNRGYRTLRQLYALPNIERYVEGKECELELRDDDRLTKEKPLPEDDSFFESMQDIMERENPDTILQPLHKNLVGELPF